MVRLIGNVHRVVWGISSGTMEALRVARTNKKSKVRIDARTASHTPANQPRPRAA